MIGLQARRRVVYRLYDEDEFLRGADVESVEPATVELSVGNDGSPRESRTPGSGANTRLLRRLAGSAMLLVAAALFAVGLLKNGPRLARALGDRPSRASSAAADAVRATSLPAMKHPSALALDGTARSRPRTHAQDGAHARALFAEVHRLGGRRRVDGDRGASPRNLSAAAKRAGVSAEPTREAAAPLQPEDRESATPESATGGSVDERSAPQAAPAGTLEIRSPNAESHGGAPASTAVAAGRAAQPSPRQMEFEFER
jgi:hypothetical protein